MFKKSIFIFTVLFSCSVIFAAGKSKKQVNVGILNGPSCIPVAYMMDKDSVNYSYEQFADPQTLLPKMIKKEIDIGFMPLNVAAKVYNSTGGNIICIAVCGNGNLSLITKDKSITNIYDLKGKTVNVAGQGATPEYMFKYILKNNDISYDGKDITKVTLDYSIPPANLAAAIIGGKIQYAVVPEPFSTVACTKDKNVFVAIDLQNEYEDLTYSNNTYPLTVIVANASFVEKNKKKVDDFLKAYKKSNDWTVKNTKEAGLLCEKLNLGLNSAIVDLAIPRCNFIFQKASEAKEKCEDLLKIFIENEPKSIGEKLPDEKFYY